MKKNLKDVPLETKVRVLSCYAENNSHLNQEGVVVEGDEVGKNYVVLSNSGSWCDAKEVEVLEESNITPQYSLEELRLIKFALDYLKDSSAFTTNKLIDKVQEDISSQERK
jgi:uncharacterized protein YrzB (UPF0473 family)